MKNQKFAKLVSVERLNNSVNGNPNYKIILDDSSGELIRTRSSSDCSWCYGYSDSWIGKTITYHMTRAGRIDYMQLTKIEDTFTDKQLIGNK